MSEILKYYEERLKEQLQRVSIGDPIVVELAIKQIKKIKRRINLIKKSLEGESQC